MAYSEEHLLLAAGLDNGDINFYDNNLNLLNKIKAHNSEIRGLAFISNTKFLASASTSDKTIIVWDILNF